VTFFFPPLPLNNRRLVSAAITTLNPFGVRPQELPSSKALYAKRDYPQAADEVVEEILASIIRDDHDGQERNASREDQAVNKNDKPRFFQVAQLGVLDLAVNLGERLLAAHGQEGVAED
jgi:hypothetical protein